MNNTTNAKDIQMSINSNSSLLHVQTSGGPTPDVVNDTLVTEGASTMKEATTTFIDDALTVKMDESMNSHVDTAIINMLDTQATEQTIQQFLAKPIIVQQGSFNITDTYSFLNSTPIPESIFNSTPGQMWLKKLDGIFGIRMDIRFRLVVNANPFQQGRYMMGWVPLAGSTPTVSQFKQLARNNQMMATLVQRTTVPHVELDISSQTSCELLIPFQSVQGFYPMSSVLSATNVGVLGYLNLYPYSPLVAPTGSTTASYTLYASFENVKLVGAAAPQSGISDKEVSSKQNGPISGVARAFAKGFKEFSHIPLLSSYASNISWIADRIAVTASVFGFSKPTQGDTLVKYQRLNAPSHTNVDGDSDARSLSFLSKPGVKLLDGLSGTTYDEMDFAYIVRKYAYYQQFTFPESAAVGNLVNIPVSVNKSLGAFPLIHFTPVSFVANMFTYWRGSLKFKFKLVKTPFHSGRLAFTFYPTDEITNIGAPWYANRMILDIREATEIELIIPYISRNPYTFIGTNVGQLAVDVIDPLVAPASVSNTITILCEIAGGDDLEFAIPASFEFTPINAVPQSGLNKDSQLVSATIGSSSISADPHVFSGISMGDKISSLRVFLKRYTPIQLNDASLSSTVQLNGACLFMRPDMIRSLPVGTIPAYIHKADFVSIVASCYAMWRGGIRVRDVIDNGMLSGLLSVSPYSNGDASNGSTVTYLQTNNNQFGSSDVLYSTDTPGITALLNYPKVIQNINQNNVVSLEVPQYTPTFARNVVDCIYTSTTSYQQMASGTSSAVTAGFLTIALPSSTTTGLTPRSGHQLHNVSRSLADDGDFSVFIAVPPLQFVPQVSTSPAINLY